MSTLTGTGQLIRLILRRDRVRLPIWLVAIAGLAFVSATGVQQIYGTPEAIAGYAATTGSSAAAIVFSGPPIALHTIAGITIFEINTTTMIGTALMVIFLAVRHTRNEEETGRAELIRSTVLGRHAATAATLIVGAGVSILLGAVLTGILAGVGLDPAGATVYGASIALLGLAFTAVGVVAAQVTAHARTASGIAGTVVGVTFLLRGLGDAGSGVLSWFSPFGWAQAVHPFAGNRWWPLLILVAFFVVAVAVAFELASHRDVGAGLVPPRPGPARADERLGTAVGLAMRLQRGSLIAWMAGLFAGGLTLGTFGHEITELAETNPTIAEVFRASGSSILDTYFSFSLLMLAVIAAGFTVSSVLRLRSEEVAGRVEPVLATALSRTRWMMGSLAVSLVGTILVVAAGGLGTGLAHGLITSEISPAYRLLASSLVYAPAALTLGALGVLLFGLSPRLTALAWAAVAFALVATWLGDVLEFPRTVMNLSPFSHVPGVPAESVTALPLVILGAMIVVGTLIGLVGLRRRDITT